MRVRKLDEKVRKLDGKCLMEKELDAERAGQRWRVLARVADDPVTPAEGVLAAESAPLIS